MTNRYVELHANSAFSFLEGGSQPEALAERAFALEMPALALMDRNGFYGYRRYGYGSLYPFYGFGWGYGYDPYYLGWGSDYSGYYDNYPAANYSYDNGAYQQPQPPVIINQGMPYAEPAPPPPSQELVVREFTPPAPPDPKDKPNYGPVLYLFALKNNSILAAFTYWTEKGELHYVNLDHQTKMVPLTSIDRDLTDRLNRERNLSVKIPG